MFRDVCKSRRIQCFACVGLILFALYISAATRFAILDKFTLDTEDSANILEKLAWLNLPLNLTKSGWQEVTSDCFVFSAYLDARQATTCVRVIALQKRDTRSPTLCLLYYPHLKMPVVAKLVPRPNPEHHSKKYAAFLYTCKLPLKGNATPYGLAVVNVRARPNFLLLKQPQEQPSINITICIPTLNTRYSNANQLVQMIEGNSMMGASKFIMYNYSIAENVNKYLNYYNQRNITQLIQWRLPTIIEKSLEENIHYFAQLAAVNDCFYRSIDTSHYIAFLDLDEIIVTKDVLTWNELFTKTNFPNNSTIASLRFKNRFFNTTYLKNCKRADQLQTFLGEPNQKEEAFRYKVEPLFVTKGHKKIFRSGQRSKFIVKRIGPVHVGIHFVWEFEPGYTYTTVNSNLAYLHHYREMGLSTSKDPEASDTPNTFFTKKGNLLLARIMKVHKHLEYNTTVML